MPRRQWSEGKGLGPAARPAGHGAVGSIPPATRQEDAASAPVEPPWGPRS